MLIESKFDINEKVYYVRKFSKQNIMPCSVCDGKGVVILTEKEYRCPECCGDGIIIKYRVCKYNTQGRYTIGHIKVIITKKKNKKQNKKEVYMFYETGIGSGTIYKEEELFKTEQEAEDHCKELNNEGISR